MTVAGCLDPIVPNTDSRAATTENQQLSYATNMITSLRVERDLERAAHDRTRHDADSRIAALEAQVSSRETELEACLSVTHADTFSQDRGQTNNAQSAVGRHLDGSADAHSRHAPTTTRGATQTRKPVLTGHEALETQVKNLFHRLNMARADIPPSPHVPEPSSGHPNRTSGSPTPNASVSAPDRTPTPTNPCIHMISVSPDLSDLATASPSPSNSRAYTNSSVLMASSGSHPSPEPRRRTVPYHETFDVFSSSMDESPLIARSLSSTHVHHSPAIRDLEQQVMDLAAKVDAFKEERELLAQLLAKERQGHSAETQLEEAVDLVQLLKEERVRLEESERTYRHELIESRVAAAARENELLQEIEQLRATTGTISMVDPMEDLLIDDNDGELAMELATPLLPTYLPSSADNTEIFADDRPFTPLPPRVSSPQAIFDVRSPEPQAIFGNAPTRLHRDVATVEQELVAAQLHLINGEKEIRHLVVVAEDLQQQMRHVDAETEESRSHSPTP